MTRTRLSALIVIAALAGVSGAVWLMRGEARQPRVGNAAWGFMLSRTD